MLLFEITEDGGCPQRWGGRSACRLAARWPASSARGLRKIWRKGQRPSLLLDGTAYVSPVALDVGPHTLEARFAVTSPAQLPLAVTAAVDAGVQEPIPPALLTHDETAMLPVINTAPSHGLTLGGNDILITGMGFFPSGQVVVHWGATNLVAGDLTVTPSSIRLVSPPGEGTITVSVTPAKSSTASCTC